MIERPLTTGETALAHSVFGDAIDYSKVRMIRRKWWPFHPRNAIMAPSGNLHFHPRGTTWSDDFSNETIPLQGFFIHEMTHVWQSQRGGRFYLPLMRHPFCRYSYGLQPGKPFESYGIEQQAEIVKDAFLAERGGHPSTCPPVDLLPFGRVA